MSMKIVYLLTFLDAFSFALVLPVGNPHVIALGGSFMLCGILQSAGAGMQLLASPIVGRWSDVYGRRLILLCMLVVTFIGDALAGIHSLQMFFIGRILYGVSHHTDPLIKAIVTDILPDKQAQTQVFNKLIALPGVAFVLGPVFGGFLHHYFGSFAIISSVLCSIDALLIAIVFMYIPDTKVEKKNETQKSTDWKKFLDLLSLKFAIEMAYNFFFVNSGVIFTRIYLFTKAQLGLSIAYMSTTMMIAAIVTPILNKRFYANDIVGLKRILHSVILMVICFVTLLGVSNPILHLALFVPAGLAKIMLEMAWMETLTARTDESEKGFMMGTASSMLSAAGLVCPLISGGIGDYVSLNILMSLPLIPTVIGAILANRIQKVHVN